MNNNIINIFKEYSKNEHCSGDTDKMFNYLKNYASDKGYEVITDEANNIYCKHTNATILLQAHYDMVCIGDNPGLYIKEDNGFLYSPNSTLGADNGIGVAMILSLMEEGQEISALFTNDEEIGLIGASNLNIKIKEKLMLNLDYEEQGQVCIGCAGAFAINTNTKIKTITKQNLNYYKISINNLPGGHSGLDIDKDIDNAIKKILSHINHIPYELVFIKGGERRNSIPSSAEIIIGVDKSHILKVYDDNAKVLRLEEQELPIIEDGQKIMDMIFNLKHGLVEYNEELNLPETSVNLAIVDTIEDAIVITISARSMDNEKLKELKEDISKELKNHNFKIFLESQYPAWKPIKTQFSSIVFNESKKIFKDTEYKAIHAGLECSIVKSKNKDLEAVSIGPNIYNPHTKREKVEIESINKVYELVKNIINNN